MVSGGIVTEIMSRLSTLSGTEPFVVARNNVSFRIDDINTIMGFVSALQTVCGTKEDPCSMFPSSIHDLTCRVDQFLPVKRGNVRDIYSCITG